MQRLNYFLSLFSLASMSSHLQAQDTYLYCNDFHIRAGNPVYTNCSETHKTPHDYKLKRHGRRVLEAEHYDSKGRRVRHQFTYQGNTVVARTQEDTSYFPESRYVDLRSFTIKNHREYPNNLPTLLDMPDGTTYRFFYHLKRNAYNALGELESTYYSEFDVKTQQERVLVSLGYYKQALVSYKVRRYVDGSIEEKYSSLHKNIFTLYNNFDHPELSIITDEKLLYSFVALYYYDRYSQKAQLVLKEEYRFPKTVPFLNFFQTIRHLNRSLTQKQTPFSKRQHLIHKSLVNHDRFDKSLLKKQFYYPQTTTLLHGTEKIRKVEHYRDEFLKKIEHFSRDGILTSEENFNLLGEKVFD